MGLYHFFWEGKERAVSVRNEKNGSMSFTFVDDEICRNISPQLLVKKSGSELLYVNEKEIVSKQKATALLVVLEKSIQMPSR